MSNTINEAESLPPPTTETRPPRRPVGYLWGIWERQLSDLHYQGVNVQKKILDLFDARTIRAQSATNRSIAASLEINMKFIKGAAPEASDENLFMPPRMKPDQDYIYYAWQRYTDFCAQGRRLFDVRKAGQGQYDLLRTELDWMKQQLDTLQKDLIHYESLLKEAKAQFNHGQPPPRLFDPPNGDDRPDRPDSPPRDPAVDKPTTLNVPHERPRNGGECTFDCGYCLGLTLGLFQTRDRKMTAPDSSKNTTEHDTGRVINPANILLPQDPAARADSDAEYNEEVIDLTTDAPYPPLPALPPPVGSAVAFGTNHSAQYSPSPRARPKPIDLACETNGLGLRGGDRPTGPICIRPITVTSIDSDEDNLSPRQTINGHIPRPPSTLSSNNSSVSDQAVNRLDLQQTATNDSDDSRTLVGQQSPLSVISISSSGSDSSPFSFNRPITISSTRITLTATQNQPSKPQNTTTSAVNPILNPKLVQNTPQQPQPQPTTKRIYTENPLLTPPLNVDLADYEFTGRTKKALVPDSNVSKQARSNAGKDASNSIVLDKPSGGIDRKPLAGLGFKNGRFHDDSGTDSGSGSGSGSSSDRPAGFSDTTSDSDTSLDRIISRGHGRSDHRDQGYGQRSRQKTGQQQHQQQKLWTKPVPFMHGGVHVNWNGNGNTGANNRKNDGFQRNGKNKNQGKNHKGDGWIGNGQGSGNKGRHGQKRGKPSSW